MSEPIQPQNKPQHTVTGQLKVACDGPVFSKHPRVWLTMVDNAEGKPANVVCPYCSHVFEYDPHLAPAGSSH